MQPYIDYYEEIAREGNYREGRNGGVISKFGHLMRFDLREGFPLFTGRHVPFKTTTHEYLWFTHGSTNIRDLHTYGVNLWDLWADEAGECKHVYGENWTRWPDQRTVSVGQADSFRNRGFRILNTFYNGELGDAHPNFPEGEQLVTVYREINQLEDLVDSLTHDPYGRRHVLTGWNPATQAEAALPACHAFYQFYVSEGRLSCMFVNRSSDALLGGAFNVPGAALLTHMLAQQCDLEVGELIWAVGDGHIYENQLEGLDSLRAQIDGQTLPSLPKLKLTKAASICEYTIDDVELLGYESLGKIYIPVSQ